MQLAQAALHQSAIQAQLHAAEAAAKSVQVAAEAFQREVAAATARIRALNTQVQVVVMDEGEMH
jgi:uncharacterized secreted protein with C-terminal beta-propeller domain